MSEPISGKQAKDAAQRLINTHFGNADPARTSIPAQPTDDDLTIMAYIEQAEARPRVERERKMREALQTVDYRINYEPLTIEAVDAMTDLIRSALSLQVE